MVAGTTVVLIGMLLLPWPAVAKDQAPVTRRKRVWGVAALGGLLLLWSVLTFVMISTLRTSRPFVASYSRANYEQAQAQLRDAEDALHRYYALADAAMATVFHGTVEDAHTHATELLEMARTRERDWNFGNAVHDGHVVLGLVALRRGDIEAAEKELLLAGETPGSPQLETFGPNMMLAKELLEHGRVETVLEYFDRCRRFWKMARGRLDQWSVDARNGETPDFGSNLIH